MTRYTMTYDAVPKTLFEKFVQHKYIDAAKCEEVKITDVADGNGKEMEISINVKN